MAIPPGFVPSVRTSPFLDLIGPVHTLDDERGHVIGLEVRTDHLNTRGNLHGAVVAALADVVLGRAFARADPPGPLVTSSLTVDFIAGAQAGDWVEATAEAVHLGGRLGFSRALLRVGRPGHRAGHRRVQRREAVGPNQKPAWSRCVPTGTVDPTHRTPPAAE